MATNKSMQRFLAILLTWVAVAPWSAVTADETALATYRSWVAEMKAAERGPFARLRWFCRDGSVLPPRPYACSGRGGGYQHGELSERARDLREQGYYVANILAGIDAAALVAAPDFADRYAQILIERFLVGADDGWILRRALFYRGAIQEEDERKYGRRLLVEMAGRDWWLGPGFPALRAGASLLPHGGNSASQRKVRQLSATLSDRDGGFKPLRAKIHGSPGPEDAAAVRTYAAGLEEGGRQAYLDLADEIDRVYRPAPIDRELAGLAERYTAAPWLQETLRNAAARLHDEAPDRQRFEATATLLADLRDALPRIRSHGVRLDMLDLSLRVERENFRAAAQLMASAGQASRSHRVALLKSAAKAAYGTGLLNRRLLAELEHSGELLAADSVMLDTYRGELAYIGRAPGWGTQTLRMHFFQAMQKLAEIEPMAMLFIQDQLRGSPLLFLSRMLDGLVRDANRLAGVRHRLFGEEAGVGLTALNPGLARGVLRVQPDLSEPEKLRPDGIYLLPETVSDLPPVAGILTGGEGNPLSHVQLLARNLGIPNVTVDDSVIAKLAPHDGEQVVLAVSPSGLVEISSWQERWVPVFESADAGAGVVIEPDLEKLDLSVRRIVSLDQLRAGDSGRTVGPKAAKLGELRAHYPDSVSRGVALPFGLYKQEVLDQPHPDGEGSIFDWMLRNYEALAKLPPSGAEREGLAESFRAELHDIILEREPSESFRVALRDALAEAFGDADLPGLFVRSDTNVEDLAGFTGAGLNLTLPNVLGFEELLSGIVRVWASPFTARAFAWRQSRMTRPEHVYASILLMESVAAEKSGVLVTQDIDTGNRQVVSVAVNEGIGGAVDGQAAESLRIPLDGSRVRVLATASAPLRRVPDPGGGLRKVPSSGSDTVLQPGEIARLSQFARDLPNTFPPITDEDGRPVPADVEFGFVNGELRLFQVRPFLENKAARGITYLLEMESSMKDTGDLPVDMGEIPR